MRAKRRVMWSRRESRHLVPITARICKMHPRRDRAPKPALQRLDAAQLSSARRHMEIFPETTDRSGTLTPFGRAISSAQAPRLTAKQMGTLQRKQSPDSGASDDPIGVNTSELSQFEFLGLYMLEQE